MDNIFGIPANTLLTILLIMMGFIVGFVAVALISAMYGLLGGINEEA